jgi:hypothetical protein
MTDLINRLRDVIDNAESNSFAVEGEFCVGKAEHAQMEAERAEARAVCDEIIALLEGYSRPQDIQQHPPTVTDEMVDAAMSTVRGKRPFVKITREHMSTAIVAALGAVRPAPEPEAEVHCPHWSPGHLTPRKGCTACEAVPEPTEGETRLNRG